MDFALLMLAGLIVMAITVWQVVDVTRKVGRPDGVPTESDAIEEAMAIIEGHQRLLKRE